jgi:hypothetical protein
VSDHDKHRRLVEAAGVPLRRRARRPSALRDSAYPSRSFWIEEALAVIEEDDE